MTKLLPNFFQRRLEWHSRVVDFEKKFEKIRAPKVKVMKPVLLALKRLPVPEPVPEYTNRVRYTIVTCGNVTEYLVTLRLDKRYDLEETKVFDNEEDALTCFHAMKCMRTLFPLYVLDEFQKY